MTSKKIHRRSNRGDGRLRGIVLVTIAGAMAAFLVIVALWGTRQAPAPGPSAAEQLASLQESQAVADGPAPVAETPQPIVRPADRPLGVVFAGDSLTYGLFASSEAAGYRPQVVAALEAGGAVEWSRGGQTGNKIQTVSESITFPATTDLIVLELGTNDVWKTAQAEIPAQYDALIAKAKTSAPNAKVVCLGVWSDIDGRRNYDTPIQASCEAAGGTFLSLADVYDAEGTKGPAGKESFGGVSDDFHPNDVGYAAIADVVLAPLGVTR